MDDLNYEELIEDFGRRTLFSILNAVDSSGRLENLADILTKHKMPIVEVPGFILDFYEVIKSSGGEQNAKSDGADI